MIVTMQDYTITDRAPVLIGYEGENLSRNFTVETADDLSGIASIELLIGDVNCGAMTVNTDDTEITISLDAFMIGRAGYKKAQLIMLDDTGAVVMKSNQFDVLVGASNNPRYFAAGEKVKTLTVNIDGRTRQIILPAGFAVSVNGDVAVDRIAFKAPASYGDFYFSAAACRVDWTGVDGTSHTNICTEKDADGNWIWALPTALTRGGEGEISFSVSYVVTNNGAVTADWNTGLVKFYHLESAKSDDAEEDVEEETTYDRLASAIAAVQSAQASVDDVNAILAGITSATPTVVETVADLNSLDTSKVKLAIVAADGYLHYYDGTAWKSGFAYGGLQEVIAARTDSDGVTYADLKTRLNTAEAQIKEDLNCIYHKEYEKILYTLSNESANLFSIYSADYLSGKGYSQNTGNIVNYSTNCISGYIPVKNGDYFKVMVDGKNIFNTSIDGQIRKVAYYNSSKVWQKTESYSPVGTNPDAIKMLYDGYIRVMFRKTDQKEIFVSSVLKDKLVDLMIFAGQSNMAGRGTTNEIFPDTAPAVIVGAGYEFRSITDPTRLYPITEPFGYAENAPDDSSGICDGTMKTGDMVASFVNAYFTNNGKIPAVCISASEGGSSSAEWQPETGNNFIDLSERVTLARSWLVDNGYPIRHQYCLWCQGESDGDDIAADRETFEEYKTRARAIFNGLIALGLEKVLLVRIGNHNSGSSTRYTDIIQWQTEEAQTNDALVMVSCDFAGMRSKGMMKDAFHYYQIGYNIAGNSAGVNAALFATTGKEPTMYDPESNSLYYSHKN